MKYLLYGNERLKVSHCLSFHYMTAFAGCRGAASQGLQVLLLSPELASPRQSYRHFTQHNFTHGIDQRSQQSDLWWWQYTQRSVSLVTQAVLLMIELLALGLAKIVKVANHHTANHHTDHLNSNSLCLRQ